MRNIYKRGDGERVLQYTNRIIVAGSRDFFDYSFVKSQIVDVLKNIDLIKGNLRKSNTIFICGMCKGSDMLGYKFAESYNFDIILLPAEWNKFNKSAGHIRNKEMAELGTHLLAFSKNDSNGTNNMIALAKNRNLTIFKYYV